MTTFSASKAAAGQVAPGIQKRERLQVLLIRRFLLGHERHERTELAIAEVQTEPRDDADDDRDKELAVAGANEVATHHRGRRA